MAAYNPKNIYQLGINGKANRALGVIETEATTVGRNISIISKQADKIKKTLSDFQVPLNLEKFHILIADLRQVLKIIHKLIELQRAVNSEKDGNKRKGLSAQMSAYNPPLPALFSKPADGAHLGTLCPLTVFLQAVASSLTTLKINSIEGAMGTAQAIIGIQQAMRTELTDANDDGDQCQGLANCIIIHEKNSRFIVVGTKPWYKTLKGLADFAWATREQYLKQLQTKLPKDIMDRIVAAERFSKQILEDTKAGNKPTQPPEGYKELVINGTNVSVTPKGAYKNACLTDWLRMSIKRPEAAQKQEDETPVEERKPQQVTSCAEWALVNYLFYSPDPENPPAQGKPIAGSHKKSDSWPKDGEKPKAAVAAAKAPQPLPNKLGEAKGGKGRAASPPGSSMNLVDRTKKT